MVIDPKQRTTLKAKSVTEFLKLVEEIRDRKAWFKGDRQWGPWFRGHQRASWPLKPKLYRDRNFSLVKANNVEDEIREEFIKRAPVLCEKVPIGSEQRAEWESGILRCSTLGRRRGFSIGRKARSLPYTLPSGAMMRAMMPQCGCSTCVPNSTSALSGKEWIIPAERGRSYKKGSKTDF